MKIVLSGGTGFLGGRLAEHLKGLKHQVTLLRRSDFQASEEHIMQLISSADVVVNLAGSPVIRRWTEAGRKEILSSRLHTTGMLVRAITGLQPAERPATFISASAIGIYDTMNIHDESSANYDDNFLSEVCLKWEEAVQPLSDLKLRVCILRIGMVLGRDGGILQKLIPLFKAGLGGKIGSGKQGFSFIHFMDFCRAVEFLAVNSRCSGIFNMTAPNYVTNAVFTKSLASACHRPAFFTVPVAGLKLIYGEAAVALLNGPLVYPRHLLDCGFDFLFPGIDQAVRAVVNEKKAAVKR